jgi:DNA end-binding protein Ku
MMGRDLATRLVRAVREKSPARNAGLGVSVAARAMWKGSVKIGREQIPVKLFAAAEDRKVHFRLLGRDTLTPVRQRMVSSSTGKEVSSEKVQKGFATPHGHFVVLDEKELESLEPKPSRTIEISRFIPLGVIDQAWYERPYYLGPDGAAPRYAALAEALRQEEMEGIAHWVMRNKEYAGALRLEGDHLVLVTLRHAGEVVPAAQVPEPKGRAPEPQEIRMAEQLVEALAGDFDPSEFQDEYRERVLALIEAKAKGKKVKTPRFRRQVAGDDLAATLKKSLAAAKRAA